MVVKFIVYRRKIKKIVLRYAKEGGRLFTPRSNNIG